MDLLISNVGIPHANSFYQEARKNSASPAAPLSLQNFSSLQIAKGDWARTMSSLAATLSSTCHIRHIAIFAQFSSFFIRPPIQSNQERALSPRFHSWTQQSSFPRTVLVLISNRLYLARPRSSFRCTQSTRGVFTVFTCQFNTGASIHSYSQRLESTIWTYLDRRSLSIA